MNFFKSQKRSNVSLNKMNSFFLQGRFKHSNECLLKLYHKYNFNKHS